MLKSVLIKVSNFHVFQVILLLIRMDNIFHFLRKNPSVLNQMTGCPTKNVNNFSNCIIKTI